MTTNLQINHFNAEAYNRYISLHLNELLIPNINIIQFTHTHAHTAVYSQATDIKTHRKYATSIQMSITF